MNLIKNRQRRENKKNNNIRRRRGSKLLIQDNAIVIEADKEKIIQVISNLLNNAIKLQRKELYRSLLRKKKMAIVMRLIVSIKDTGEGIDPEILPKLFSKFEENLIKGTGLGLFISKSIVEAQGGRIWAKNNADGKGATFSFTLPLN